MQPNPAIRPAIGTALLLSIPLAMTFIDRNRADGDGWRWGPEDFLIMGALLFTAGFGYEILARHFKQTIHKIVLGLALAFVVFVIWVELAVDGVSKLIAYLGG